MADYKERSERILKEYRRLESERVRLEERRNVLLDEMERKYGVKDVDSLKALYEEKKQEEARLIERITPLLDSLEQGLGISGKAV